MTGRREGGFHLQGLVVGNNRPRGRRRLHLLGRQVGVSRVVVRRALVGVGDPLALAVSHRRPVVALDVRRGVMPAVGDVLLVVDAAIRHFLETPVPQVQQRERSSCELDTRGACRTLIKPVYLLGTSGSAFPNPGPDRGKTAPSLPSWKFDSGDTRDRAFMHNRCSSNALWETLLRIVRVLTAELRASSQNDELHLDAQQTAVSS